jgi:hypothetical protein
MPKLAHIIPCPTPARARLAMAMCAIASVTG